MMSIVVIRPNEFMFDRNKYYNNLGKLQEDIAEFADVIEVNDFMETIITQIGLTPELIGSSPICCETDTNIYQICFATERDKNFAQTSTNFIGNCLTNDTITNNCVLINSKIGENKICVNDNADLSILTKILYSKFIHKGIFVKTDSSVS